MHLLFQRAARALLVTCAVFQTSRAWADDAEPSAIQVHGFVSQGYIKTTSGNNYLGPTARKQGSFEFTEVGINFTKQLGERFRVGLQLFAHDLGPHGNYSPKLDWYHLDYRFADWLGLRAGKTKLPVGLYNEANDVDAGRVPVLLPQSVYPVTNRESLFAQTGGELYGDLPLGSLGSLEYRLFGGTIFIDTSEVSVDLKEFEVPYAVGGRAMWHPPVEGLQLGATLQFVRFDYSAQLTPEQRLGYEAIGQLPPGGDGFVWIKFPARLWVASAEYQSGGMLLAAEYARSYFDVQTNLLLPSAKQHHQGGYVLASYQLAPWFTPGIYYSATFPDFRRKRPPGEDQNPPSSYQHDVALTLRYDVHPNWLFKLEQHYMYGTAGLSPELNPGRKPDELNRHWGVFLLKTTGYF